MNLAVCRRILTVNDYREYHTKVWVAYLARTITHHMNYEWRFSFQYLFYTSIKGSISLEKPL